MTTNDSAEIAYRSFSEGFFHALVEAITEATGSPWLVAAVPDAQPAADESEPLRITLVFEGEIQGEFLLSLRSADAVLLAAKCLRQEPEEVGTEQTAALLKVVEAGVTRFCSAAAQQYGEFAGVVSIASAPTSENASVVELTAGDDGGNRISLLMHADAVLVEALTLRESSEIADPAAGQNKQVSQGQVTPGQLTPGQLNLQLVLDVELNVTLRFGQRQLTLREVLELTSGSVIELDRQVEEPVELLLEGKVIARGEAVVINGNYGLRVTEVPQPVSAPTLR